MHAPREWLRLTRPMRDEEGRPLGESKLPPEQRPDVPLQQRPCPYAGSRHNHPRPMNVSALRQMSAHWQEALGGIALLRSMYCEERKQERLRLVDVWRVAGLTTSLVPFAFLRGWSPVADGQLPAAVAVAYKAALGVSFTCEVMLSDGAAPFDAPVDAETLYDFADRQKHFIGPQEVCAGPEAMVKDLLRLLVDGTGPRGDPAATAAVLSDGRRFLQFAHATASLDLLRLALARMDARTGMDLVTAVAADPESPPMTAAVRECIRLTRFQLLDRRDREHVLDELFKHATGPSGALAELEPGIRAIRETWSGTPPESARVGLRPPFRAATDRFCAAEQGFATLVGNLKGHFTDALGIHRADARARELLLTGYVPTGIQLTRTLLRDLFDLTLSPPAP